METEGSLPCSQQPVPIYLRSILILPSLLRLCLLNGILFPGCPTKSLFISLHPNMFLMPRQFHLPPFDRPRIVWCAVQVMKLLVIMLFSNILILHLLRHKYLPQHPVRNTLRLSYPLNIGDQVSHPHKGTNQLQFCNRFILIFIFRDSKQEGNRFSAEFKLAVLSSSKQFSLVSDTC